jgi:hypothetical protein
MSSSRHWNVLRHLERSHNGFGQPVSDQHTIQYLTKMNPQIPHFPLSYHLPPTPHPFSMSFPHQKQKNSPYKAYDFVDRLLEPLRKAVEFKNLLSQVSRPVSHQQQHNIAGSRYHSTPSAATFNSGDSRNIISHQPHDPKDILGYRGMVCNDCLDIEVEEVRFSKYVGKGGILKMSHICDPKRIVEIHQHNNNNPIDKSIQLKKLETPLILWLKELVVNNWTKNKNYLYAIEVPNPPKDCIDLTIPAADDDHWAARAIKNIHILLSDDEFINFLQKVKNSTFAVFRIKWHGSVIYYWMGITNAPISKLPNSSFDSSNQQEYDVDNT